MVRERGNLGLAAVLVLLAGPGCGEDRALNRDDVTGLPAGTAVGTTFSGSYLLESGSITGCHCRVGSCAGIAVTPGSSATVVQQDGRLTLTNANSEASVGGIDADGTFSVGSVTEQPGATVYSLTKGQFMLANGQPASADFTATSTDIVHMAGLDFDCDIDLAGRLRYQGP